MARVTIEDCIKIVPNRFELCLIANNRAKSILSGVKTSLNDGEKPSVISLREIAESLVDVKKIRNNIIESAGGNNLDASDIVNENASMEILEESENTTPLSSNIFLEDNIVVND